MTQPEGYPDGLEFHVDLTVGEILRRTRTHYGQTLDDVGAALRIRPSQLEAIETGHLEQLPGRVYAIGFVRGYSEYLGLDGDKMVYLFKQQSVGNKARVELNFPVPPSESKVPHISLTMAGVIGAVIILIVWGIFYAVSPSPATVPDVPENLSETSITEAPSVVAAAPPPVPMFETAATTAAKEASEKTSMVLEIVQSSWIEIKNKDGASILRQVLKAGDKYMVPDEPGLTLSTGNAGGILVKVGTSEGMPLGKVAEVKRNIPLKTENWTKKP
jgi:cytoskeleton protein RodZ